MLNDIILQGSFKTPTVDELTQQLFENWSPTFSHIVYSPLNRNIVITAMSQELLDLLVHIKAHYSSMGEYDKSSDHSDETGRLGELAVAKYLGLNPDFSSKTHGKGDLLDGRVEVKASLTPYKPVTDWGGYAIHNQHILVKPDYYWRPYKHEDSPENPVYEPIVYVGVNVLSHDTKDNPFVVRKPEDIELADLNQNNFHTAPFTLIALISSVSARTFHANIRIFTKGINIFEKAYLNFKELIDRMSNVDFNHRLACPHFESSSTEDITTASFSLEKLKRDLPHIATLPKYSKYSKNKFKERLSPYTHRV